MPDPTAVFAWGALAFACFTLIVSIVALVTARRSYHQVRADLEYVKKVNAATEARLASLQSHPQPRPAGRTREWS